MSLLYQIVNVFFFVFHISLILFNLFGWISKRYRLWNLLTLGLTAFSWLVLGIFYGFGYCFLTDWHWLIRERLGYANPYNSYIHFLIVTVFPISIAENTVNWITALSFAAALIMSLLTNTGILMKKK